MRAKIIKLEQIMKVWTKIMNVHFYKLSEDLKKWLVYKDNCLSKLTCEHVIFYILQKIIDKGRHNPISKNRRRINRRMNVGAAVTGNACCECARDLNGIPCRSTCTLTKRNKTCMVYHTTFGRFSLKDYTIKTKFQLYFVCRQLSWCRYRCETRH